MNELKFDLNAIYEAMQTLENYCATYDTESTYENLTEKNAENEFFQRNVANELHRLNGIILRHIAKQN